MIELLNSKVVRVAMAMAACTAGCVAPADDAADVDVDDADAVEVEEAAQAFSRPSSFGCDPLRIPFRYPISNLRNCGGWGGWSGWTGSNWGGWGSWGAWGGGWGGWGGGAFNRPCSGSSWGNPAFGWSSPYGGVFPGMYLPNRPC